MLSHKQKREVEFLKPKKLSRNLVSAKLGRNQQLLTSNKERLHSAVWTSRSGRLPEYALSHKYSSYTLQNMDINTNQNPTIVHVLKT